MVLPRVVPARARHPLNFAYRGTSLVRNNAPLGPQSGTMPRDLWLRGPISYERGTPVGTSETSKEGGSRSTAAGRGGAMLLPQVVPASVRHPFRSGYVPITSVAVGTNTVGEIFLLVAVGNKNLVVGNTTL